MKGIICSSFFAIKKSNYFVKTCIIFILITLASIASGIMQMNDTSIENLLGSIDTCSMFNTITIVSFVSLYVGSEFKNKTNYYLIMNGNSRFNVYLGKLCAITPYVLILGIIQCLIIFLLLKLMLGGEFIQNEIPNFILKSVSSIAVYYSYAVLSLSLSFIFKSTLGGIGGSIIIMVLYNVIFLLLDYLSTLFVFGHKLSEYFGMFVFRYIISDTANIGYIAMIAMLYLFIAALYALIGYSCFKKEDLT